MKKLIFTILLFLCPFPSQANDATATIGMGGITLQKSDHIAMESEDLYISTKQVRVNYVFKNTSTQDIQTTVAFPMPVLNTDELMVVDANVDRTQPINFIDFKVQVNGAPITYKTEVKALVDGKDVSTTLKKHGIPLSPFNKSLHDKLKNLPISVKSELKAQNIFTGMAEKAVYPNWKLKITFYWQQNFPAGKNIRVSHQYRPVVGLTFWVKNSVSYYRKAYCIDAGTERALNKKSTTTQNLMVQNIGYILQTGANWQGSIKDFKLTVDKGNVDNIISLCATGVKKTGPTSFTMSYKNFVPKEDLKILIVGKNSNLQ